MECTEDSVMASPAGSTESLDELWSRYLRNQDPSAREELILQYAYLVKFVVGRLAINLPTLLDRGDLTSHGAIGLIDALERYDPERGVKFESYAMARIRGAILDAVRALDIVPRSTRQRARQAQKIIAEIMNEQGRQPTNEELSERLGIPIDRVDQHFQDIGAATMSLDHLLGAREDDSVLPGIEDKESPNPEMLYSERELKDVLTQSLAVLTERQRLVLSLYYIEELTMREIARVMEISESRVCQLHAKAIFALRAKVRLALYGTDGRANNAAP